MKLDNQGRCHRHCHPPPRNRMSSSKGRTVDTASLDGLRGVAAVWVMVFHCFIYSPFPIDLQGSSIMPLFFLLSGFSLMLAYGHRFAEAPSTAPVRSLLGPFLQNRLARTYPTYFLCSAFAAPLWWAGYYGDGTTGGLLTSAAASVLLASTAACFAFGVPLDGPGWTVCTLFVMWVAFPWSARSAKRCGSSAALVRKLVQCYYLQLLLVFAVFVPVLLFLGYNAVSERKGGVKE